MDRPMAHTATLITQLRALEQLTRTEAQIARIRVAQARTEAVRRELRQNADNADARSRRIVEQLRRLGGIPDVVTPAIGRVVAFVKAAVEQAQPIDEALLGDLMLEHQLLDRARYVKGVAAKSEERAVENLAEDLITAHEATVEWLTTVLVEEALGGPAALEPTPLQRVAGVATRAAALPTRFAVEGVNRLVDTVQRTSADARATVGDYAGRVVQFGQAGGEVVAAGRDAALRRAEHVADREGADRVAEGVHDTRRDLGVLDAKELPIQRYEELTAQNAIAEIRKLREPGDVQAVIRFEEHHKDRTGVVSAAQTHYASIAKETAGV